MKDYYAILGLSCTATAAEIDAAFRNLAKQHHPDVNPHDKDAIERFKLASEAHEVLSNAEKRRDYDLAQRRRGQVGVKTVFRMDFPEGGSSSDFSPESLDIEADLPIAPEEARWGGPIEFRLSYPITCPECSGSGHLHCSICGGEGVCIESQSMRIEIPPRVSEGAILCVSKRGRAAPSGRRGDLRLVVRVRPCW